MPDHAVGSGMIDGGWTYVIIVYVATWLTVIGLAARAFMLSRSSSGSSSPPETP